MARGKDLAALAGLAGLAYAMSNKSKPEQENKGRQSEDAGYKSTETREEPRRQITDYMKKAPLDGTEMYPSGVMGGASQPKPVSKLATKPAATSESIATEDSQSGAPLTPPTSAQRTDQLANLSRAVNREAKTKYAATQEPASPAARDKYYATGQDSDAMKVASRAAAAADRQRRIASGSAYKKGGAVKKMASGGMASSASKRADGIASKGKTKCKMY
jgi:hypothetical protein